MTWTEPLAGWHRAYDGRRCVGDVRGIDALWFWQVFGGRGGCATNLDDAKRAIERRGLVAVAS